jgi:hypothetical protein
VATTSAWGAACFIRVRSHLSWVAVSRSQSLPWWTGVTRTAATLKTGCLETGSQAVSVSSLAARGTRLSGSTSKYP